LTGTKLTKTKRKRNQEQHKKPKQNENYYYMHIHKLNQMKLKTGFGAFHANEPGNGLQGPARGVT